MSYYLPILPRAHDLALGFVTANFNITAKELASPSRQQHLVEARRLFTWAIKTHCPTISYEKIGEWLGDRDHSTTIALHRKAILARLRDDHFDNLCRLFTQTYQRRVVIAEAALVDEDFDAIDQQIANLRELRGALTKRFAAAPMGAA